MTNKIPTGRFVWFEYSSKDLPKSQGFFGELFNWSTQSVPMEKGAYTMIASGDATIGGYAMPTSMKGAPDAWWLSHLQVADAAASAKQVAKLGGKVLQEPIDIKVGIMAVVADPLGGVFALWQPTNRAPGEDYRHQTGSFCWNELYTSDVDASVKFYQAIGGFEVEKTEMPGMGTYVQLKSDGQPRAGILKSPMPGVPQSWLPYVSVANADATHDKAKKLGGTSLVPPTTIPSVGKFAVLKDLAGAAIGILQPEA
jgi:predicted enzyme related to lactoylglutathione lyase